MLNRTSSRALPRPPPVPRAGVAAVILAAGSSSRMGQAKPLMPLMDKPLLAHVLDAVRASNVREIVVVLGADSDRIQRAIRLDGTRVVVHAGYRDGMSSSIQTGVRAASPLAEAFLIVLGDQPLVAPATIDALVARRREVQARAVVPTFRGTRGNPVLLDRTLAGEIEAVRGDVGCRGVLEAHADEVVELPVGDPGVLLDVDTPQDLQALEAALRAGTPLDRLVAR